MTDSLWMLAAGLGVGLSVGVGLGFWLRPRRRVTGWSERIETKRGGN